MKKSIIVTIVCALLFTSFPILINAEEQQIAYSTDYVNVRMQPSSSGTFVESLDPGVRLTIQKKLNNNVNGCTDYWYEVKYYTVKTGYVCGDYLMIYNLSDFNKTAPTTEYEQLLYNNGFTDPSYWPYLTALHEQHPTWNFIAYHPNKPVTFETVVKEESETLGKSLIQFVTKNFEGWKNVNSLNYLTDTYATNYGGGGSTWYAAAPEVVAHYLDPRNFINEKNIFMFEVLAYNETYHTTEGVQNFLNGTFMEGKPEIVQEDIDRNMTYAEIFIEAAKQTGVSPYSLISRVFQEVGRTGRNTIVSGTVPGFEGYFNFYNIRATGNQDQIITNGLTYAKEQEWDSEYDAIIGGAKFLNKDYISAGQDNLYLQKWDIVGDYYYTNQYMQNIEAPADEAVSTYKTYLDNNQLENSFTFKIPVYLEMPPATELPDPKSPNNWLKDVTIAGAFLENFNPEITEPYTYYVAGTTKEITIHAAAINSQATITGTGVIPLTNDTTVHTITVTAGNGQKRDYKITFIKSEVIEATVDEIIDNIGVRSDGTYISGIPLGTPARTIIDNIKKYNGKATVVIKDSNGTEKVDQILGTGDTITITSGKDTKTFTFVIYGDLNGDGEITIHDLLRVQKIILKSTNLDPAYQMAGDVNRDGEVAILDLLRVQKHILGAYVIEQ